MAGEPLDVFHANLCISRPFCFELTKQNAAIYRQTPLPSPCSVQSEFSSAARPFRAHHITRAAFTFPAKAKVFANKGALSQKRRFACASNYFILRAKSLKRDESFCLISEKTRGRAALPKTKRKAPIVISTKRSAWRNLCNKYRPYCFLLPTPKKYCNDSIFQEISRLRAAPPFHSVRLPPRSARNDEHLQLKTNFVNPANPAAFRA